MQMNRQNHVRGETRLPLPDRATGLSGASYFEALDRLARASFCRKVWSHLRSEFDRFLYVGVRNARSIQAYNEESFRYLLANESKRSERSGRSFHVVLVYLTAPGGSTVRMDNEMATKLLSALSCILRETDYIGWYRDDLIVGGVLTALGDIPTAEVSRQIEQRFVEVLRGGSPVGEFSRLQLRLFRSDELERVESVAQVFALN